MGRVTTTIATCKHRKTQEELTELLMNLRGKIKTLEREKSGLLAEINSLKEKGEAKAHVLENEVTALRKEVKALEKLLKIKEKEMRNRSC